jgi:hypothetical protein
MAKEPLTNEAKTFIVQALACFDTPSVVAKSVKDELGIEVTRQHVEAYDPTKRAGATVAKRWRELFEATRKTFLEDTSTIGISHRSVRIRSLQRYAATAEKQGNLRLAAELMEQAAKEMGDAYTNRRILTGKNGEALVPTPIAPITGAEVAQAVKDIGEAFLGKR